MRGSLLKNVRTRMARGVRNAGAFGVLLFAPCVAARAQTTPPPSAQAWVNESWTVEDGLPVNSINAIVQDKAGYIWAATFDGLVRFDGVRFTVFNTANSGALPSNRVVNLIEARDGALWLVTEQGHIVRFRNGAFTHMPYESDPTGGVGAYLLEDSSGTIWVGNPIGLWKLRNDRMVRVGKGTIDRRVTVLKQARDGTLYAATDGGGLFTIGAGDRMEKLPADPAFDHETLTRFFEDASGDMYVAGTVGLWVRRNGRITRVATPSPFFVRQFAQVPSTGELFIATTTEVYQLDGDRARFVRPTTDGIHIWADSTGLWSVNGRDILRDGRLVYSLPDLRIVSSSLFDREGSLWFGTDSRGIFRLKPSIFESYSTREGLSFPIVYPTYVDRSGVVWLGTWKGGVNRLDPAVGRVTRFAPGSAPVAVNSFHEDGSGTLWVAATYESSGVYACSVRAMSCHVDEPPDLRGRAVFALYGDALGGMWAGAANMLYRYDGKTWASFPPSTGAPDATVRAFARTPDGAIWMGTNGGGLARYQDGAFVRVTQQQGLPGDLIRSLYVDADGWLWVGTEGRGLARIDPRKYKNNSPVPDEAIVRIGARDGLVDETIHQILEDDAGRLWMNTNRGIFWVPRTELIAFADGRTDRVHATAYAERDGMRNREGNGGMQPAGAKTPDGRLWFPTQDGVVAIDPAKVRRERLSPPLVIEQLVSRNQVLIPEQDAIALQPAQRDVQIEYTALTFLEPRNVRFRYRLDPYDANWIDVGNRRTAFYTKVPPGKYTFRVEASDAAGGWFEPGVALAVNVLPRFWETSLFQALALLALGVLLFVAVRVRELRLRARAVQLERTVTERTATLRDRERELADRNVQLQSLDQAKTRFFANVSHELRTPLTLTIGPLEDLRARAGGDPQVERWLDIALRSSRRLLRLVNQILDVAKLEAGAMHLMPRQLDLVPFTRGIVGAFTPVAERKGIRLTSDAVDALPGAFDADAVEKIITNLLSNAMKFTPSGGTVHVSLTREGDSARLLVRDSGPGIPADQLPHVFERFYQVDESMTRSQPGTGIGLALVKELVELHGGKISVESSGVGTTFAATIAPVAHANGELTALDADSSGGSSLVRLATGEAPGAALAVMDDATVGDDTPTMLVVDDSADLRSYIRDHFAGRFRVLEAGDGAEGIELARRELPDIILSDVMMPGTDGNELVRALRESPETNFLCIVLLTAQAEDEHRLAGLERGADEYLVKPFEMRELDVRVRNLIAARRRLRDRFAARAPETPPPPSSNVSPTDQAYATKVREAIREKLSDPEFGVGELADAVAQDRSNLFRRVKQVFGETPSELIRRLRLEEGETLLREGSATVTDVAYAVGFNSLSYFCRCFQETYGETPAAYRSRAHHG